MEVPITADLQQNLAALRAELGQSMDLIFRTFTTGFHGGRKALLVCLDVLSDGEHIKTLIDAATRLTNPPFSQQGAPADPVLALKESIVRTSEVTIETEMGPVVNAVLTGQTAMFVDGSPHALVCDTRHNTGRTPDEPATESEVRGPRDGFVENVMVNLALIRRRVRDRSLRFEALQVGKRTRTDVAVGYIRGVVDPGIVAEVRKRIQSLHLDALVGSGQLEEFIRDSPLSPFPLIQSSERPDRVAAALLEGRVAIVADNTPFVLLVPTSLWSFIQAPGDYYHNFWVGTGFRWLRVIAMMVALCLPALYVMLTTFHHEMIPTPLALSVAGGREGTPLPTLLETLLMEIMFEILQEAGLRLPRAVGQTVSIVGALVIGEAAVQAGLVAPATVIVTATAGITSFAMPVYSASLTLRLLRFPVLLVSGVLGVFGFLTVVSALVMHMCSLRSFGQPFLAPVAPLQRPELRDTLWRAPLWKMDRLPRLSRKGRTRRQAPDQAPQTPGTTGGGGP